MKTVFIAFYEAFPPASGAASVSYNLSRLFPGEKTLIQMTRDNTSRSSIGEMMVVGIPYSSDVRPLKLGSVAMNLFRICKKIKKINPNVIVLEGASWAGYHLGLLRLLRIKKIDCPIVYHSHNVEYYLRKKHGNGLLAFITRKAERSLVREADIVTAVSSVDASAFKSLYGINALIVPNGVAEDRFHVSAIDVARIGKKYGISSKTALFMGLVNYPPNRDAIDSLVMEIFPQVLRRIPDARLAIIGGRVPYRRGWLMNPGSIPFEEVPAFISACSLCVAPIRSGSGTRIKILEYMAAGLPVVSTTKGAEGLDMTPETHLLIADTTTEFSEAMTRIFLNPDFSNAMASAARQRVRDSFSWEKISNSLAEEIHKFVANRNIVPGSKISSEKVHP